MSSSQRILVTGGEGQLAQALRWVLAQGTEGGAQWIFPTRAELDITRPSSVAAALREHQPRWVVNTAAYTAVDRAEQEPERAMLVNATAVDYLARAVRRHNADTGMDTRLLHLSTDYVFGSGGNRPFREDEVPHPQGQYAVSKRQGELRALSSGIATVLRTSWLYSPFGHNFYLTVRERLRQGQELRVVYDQVGTPTSALSLARAICSLVADARCTPGVLHYADLGIASWYDFACEIRTLTGGPEILPIRSENLKQPAPRPAFSVLDTQRARGELSLTARHWREALRECHQATG
ncbi:MAG: dTDP-4-dehydrorhamnose reductase [Bacteroidia bacterium]|nr:MAG: dTDP-4-dehydrorhamnose reductase [Bacteroidia bacterium]